MFPSEGIILYVVFQMLNVYSRSFIFLDVDSSPQKNISSETGESPELLIDVTDLSVPSAHSRMWKKNP